MKRTPTDSSNAIILTFDSRWRLPLTQGEIRVVFRKMGPTDFIPDTVYAYIASPDSAIVARAPILAYETLGIQDALDLADDGKLSRRELLEYVGEWKHLIVMRLGNLWVADTPITYAHLSEKYNYWPSSTFIPLSATGKNILDKLGKFAAIE